MHGDASRVAVHSAHNWGILHIMVHRLKRIWHKTPHLIRKPTVFVVGWAVVAAGVAMLVLPGPGWATIFVGFAILATEFASAQKVHTWLVARLRAIIATCKRAWFHFARKR